MRTPAWVTRNPKKAARLGASIQEALREIGVLLIAFGPLEATINKSSLRDAWGFLALSLGGGLVLFVGALVLEWRRSDAD